MAEAPKATENLQLVRSMPGNLCLATERAPHAPITRRTGKGQPSMANYDPSCPNCHRCSRCNGNGSIDDHNKGRVTCPACNGVGGKPGPGEHRHN